MLLFIVKIVVLRALLDKRDLTQSGIESDVMNRLVCLRLLFGLWSLWSLYFNLKLTDIRFLCCVFPLLWWCMVIMQSSDPKCLRFSFFGMWDITCKLISLALSFCVCLSRNPCDPHLPLFHQKKYWFGTGAGSKFRTASEPICFSTD